MASGLRERVGIWLRPAVYLGHNKTTMAGAVLTTSTALTLLWFWAFEILKGGHVNPYAGMAFYLILPGIFLLGLVLMPLGVFLTRWRLRRAGTLPAAYPQIDLGAPTLRRAIVIVSVLTILNIAILGISTYRGVEYMDSAQFCGQTCHSVMAPEYTAYEGSPHSRVGCVGCHIGPGAPWFVQAKISGLRQVVAVTLKTYSRPIPSPVHQLRPARETCEQCHWPQKFTGDRLVVRKKFADDEANSATTSVLVLKIGGWNSRGASGIHGRHLDAKERISYETSDGRRQVISKVTYLDDAGKTVEYVSTETKNPPGATGVVETRKMDCMDCHNRPTHVFNLPERSIDQALSEGRISPELPFIKKKGVEALRAESDSRTGADERIANAITSFYKSTYPDVFNGKRAKVEEAVQQVQAIYRRNVFPEMKVTWGTYPNNLGHDDFPGCFRCHDGTHKSADGKVISAECDSCHAVLAMDEADPKILADLGQK